MDDLTLVRVAKSDAGTFGVVVRQYLPVYKSLELPDRNNQENVSCVLPGRYLCTVYNSPTKGLVFLLHNVPGRINVEIHVANTTKDLLGCIGLGQDFGQVVTAHDAAFGIVGSRKALDDLLNQSAGDSFWLTIVDAPVATTQVSVSAAQV